MSAFFGALWNHPAGPKTIHFWAPMCKWGLFIAGLADIHRPVEQVSTFQSAALAMTGLIWMRYSMVITPVNYSLLSVNACVGASSLYQLARIFRAGQLTSIPSSLSSPMEASDDHHHGRGGAGGGHEGKVLNRK